jgi:hypothetical protein
MGAIRQIWEWLADLIGFRVIEENYEEGWAGLEDDPVENDES